MTRSTSTSTPASSTARGAILAAVADLLPATVNVIPYARHITPPSRPTVMIRVDLVRPGVVQSARGYEAALVLIPSKDDPTGPADDELDALLEAVLDALDRAEDLTWSTAERATYQDSTNPAYEIKLDRLQTTTGNTDPNQE